MPYAPPSSPTSQSQDPRQEQQQHGFSLSQGRAGHRRSWSHTHIVAPETTAFTSTTSSLGALPRRRPTASAPSTPGPSVRDFGAESSGPSTSYFGPNSGSTRKPTFQLGRDDDDDDSSSEENQNQRPPKISVRRDADNDDEEEKDDQLRLLPPLKLRIKTSPFDTAPAPQQHGQGLLAVPFPRSSPRTSPTNSPSVGASSLPFPAPESLHTRSVSAEPAPPGSLSNPATRLLRPSFSRTSSSPILLSNGRPLKSSLKSSSSSPNIPFPPQSLVPSILWPDLHRKPDQHHQHHHPHYNHQQHHHHHHERAASAPATPHITPPSAETSLSLTSSQASLSPPPSLSSSVTSDSTTTSVATSNADSSGSTSPTSPSPPPSPGSYHYQPHPPKNVHFPSQDETLATVKIFNRSARPASLSLSRAGEDTETETEGETSGTSGSGLGKWGWGWSAYSGSGYGRFHSPSSSSLSQQGYPFPKVSKSPLTTSKEKEGDQENQIVVEKEWYYDIDPEHTSDVPMRGAERADGNVYLESVGFVRADSSSSVPSRPLTLTGTLLVRNVTYQKTVAIRFTLDDWHTTNDVLATHEKSLSALPGSFWGRREGRQGEKVLSPYALESSGPGSGIVFGDKPAWDRFRFSINLEDYATSESLEKRTMWLVGRYSAGVAAGSSGGQIMVQPPGGGSGAVSEWWDNNCGRNYGVGFRRVEREKKLAVDGRERKDGVFGASGHKRGVILSAPSAYSPPQLQGGGKSYPAPPQISSSLSFPSGHAQAQAMYNSQHQQSPYRQQQTAPATLSYQQQPESSPSVYQQLTHQHQQHQAALAQSTLARLKKLNLRNYAAPTSPSASSLVSASTVTSTESTPVHTPTQDDVSRNVLPHDDDELAAELGIDVLSPSADRRGVDIAKPRSITSQMADADTPSASDSMIGTTPPFSTLGSSPSAGGRAMGPNSGLYWPWGSFGDVVSSFGAKKEAEARDDARDSKQVQEFRLPAAPAANADAAARPEADANVASLLENIKERSMAPPPLFGGPGGVMPPQRRRKDSAHRRDGAATGNEAHTSKPTFSIGGGSFKRGSSSSGSGSGSDSGSGTAVARWDGGYRPASPAPRPGLIRNPGGSLGVVGGKSSPSPVSSTSFRISPIPSPSRSPLATPTPSAVSVTSSSALASTSSPLSSATSTPTAVPATPTPTSTNAQAAQNTDDALYQAFVRQWCFAQGPGPGPGPATSSVNGGQEGPTLQVR